jgi:choline dehydrogenase-like flavoprotein
MLTQKEKTLRIYLKILSWIYLIIFIALVLKVFIKPNAVISVRTPFVVFLLGFVSLKFLMCWYAVSDLRRFELLVKLLIWSFIITAIFSALTILKFDIIGTFTYWRFSITYKNAAYLLLAFSLLNAIVVSLLYSSAEKQRLGLQYFSPIQFRTLASLAEVIIYGEDEIITGEDVAHNVDTYFNSFKAKSKWTMALVVTVLYYYPLFSLKPPLPYISPEGRLEFLKKRFYRDVESRIMPEILRIAAQGLIRIAKQMCYIGYYNDKRTFASVGYVPFSERKDFKDRINQYPLKKSKPLDVKTESDLKEESIESDVIIIGSGAAASILAKGLVESGRKVLMVERGDYVTPETYNENEMDMVSRLYADGAIQAARDFRFTVFQGSCVGGSTVVNNAVCFKMPEEVLDKWNRTDGINAGLNKKGVLDAVDKVWDMIGVRYMPEEKIRLNPGGALFKEGCKKLGFNKSPNMVDSVNANIADCLGCGYCNIGCKYGKKLSMLETILPGIQEKYGNVSFQIIAGCEAVKLHKKGNKIDYLEGEFGNKRKIKIYGKTFVVSAGAISSSILLLKSKLGLKNAGKYLAFNVGSQLTAAYPQKIDSYDGLQISHYFRMSPGKGFIMESWFNPPMFQSTAMPGWFEDHYKNMRRYDHLACVGLLVGSESNAEVTLAGLTRREIKYKPSKKDFNTLLEGIELASEILFASGAESVMPNTFKYYEFKAVEEAKKLHQYIKDPSEITLGTGHPQGGNIIGSSAVTGAVNNEFKAFGYDNLYVCDASVFPTSVGVNPQMTVMGLADYAVQFVKDNNG